MILTNIVVYTIIMSMVKNTDDFLSIMAAECLGFRVRRLNRVVSAYYDDALRPFKAKISQVNILIIVGRRQNITPSELSKIAKIDTSTLSRNLERIIARNWIQATPSADGRSYLLSLTTNGKMMLKKIYPAWKEAQKKTEILLGNDLTKDIKQLDQKLLKTA